MAYARLYLQFSITLVSLFFLGTFQVKAQTIRPIGVDVSNWNGTQIDWASAKNAGITFAWTKATEGVGFTDAAFAVNEVNAKQAGVLIGAYHYARPDLGNTAKAEADWFWSVAKKYVKNNSGHLMPVLDLESANTLNMSKSEISAWANLWCKTVVTNAAVFGVIVSPMIYTYPWYAKTYLDSSVTQWPLWMATYSDDNPQTGNPALGPWPTWTVWQHTSSGTIPGGDGACDLDVFNGTMEELTNALVVGSVVITNQPTNVTATVNGSVLFRVFAGGPALSYQWRFNQTNIPGATSRFYRLEPVKTNNAGGYSVVVSNQYGSKVSTTAFLSIITPLTNTPGCQPAPYGMVDWWPADANAKDIFGTNDATPMNTVSYTSGKQGQAFYFDGTSSYLTVPNVSSLSNSWTLSLWVNRLNAPGSGAALMGDGDYELKLEQYNGTREVGFTKFGTGDYSFGYIVPAGTWTHLAFVGTTTGTTLYVNGSLYKTLQPVIPLPRSYIGAGYVASTGKLVDFMQGSLDELLMFNRALTASEIRFLYTVGGKGLVRITEFSGITPMGNGQCRINLRGMSGKNIDIFSSYDLKNWSQQGRITNPFGTTSFIDTATTNTQKFFRFGR